MLRFVGVEFQENVSFAPKVKSINIKSVRRTEPAINYIDSDLSYFLFRCFFTFFGELHGEREMNENSFRLIDRFAMAPSPKANENFF